MISEQEAFETTNLIRNYNPTTEFIFWHGNADTDAPHSLIEEWSTTFERNMPKSKIVIQPNLSNWSFLVQLNKNSLIKRAHGIFFYFLLISKRESEI